MPGTVMYPRSGYTKSRAELRKIMGRGKLYEFLDFYTRDVVYQRFDFTEKALDTTNVWTVGAGATATTWAITAGVNGFIRGSTGTTAATSGLQLITPLALFSGTKFAGAAIRFRTSDITESRIEFGFVDALPAVNTTVVNSLATPTFNTAALAALYLYNHTGSTTTMGLYTIGSVTAAAKTATTTNAPVNATWQTVQICVLGTNVYLWVDGNLLLSQSAVVEAADATKLAVSIKNNSTTSQNIDLDWIEYWADRT